MWAVIRILEFSLAWGIVAFAVRHLVLALREPGVRRERARGLGLPRASVPVDRAVAAWRRSLGRSLLINGVVIPILFVAALVAAAELATGIRLD